MTEPEREEWLTKQLNEIGVEVSKQHFSGDNSYPTEYTVSFGALVAVAPTLDMAMLEFIRKGING